MGLHCLSPPLLEQACPVRCGRALEIKAGGPSARSSSALSLGAWVRNQAGE